MATSIPATTTAPASPVYVPTEGTNYYVPGRNDVVQPGGALASGNTAYANVIAGTSYAGLNQHMQQVAEHFDPFIQRKTIKHPSYWRDLIPRAGYKFFNGLSAETRIFRGGLPHMAGLADFEMITDNPADGVCTLGDYSTYSYGWERLEWHGWRRNWGSEPICLDTLLYKPQAAEQLAWILQVGAEFGSSIQEVWNRDMFVYQSVVRDRSYVMTSAYDGSPTAAKYFYNPFVKAADVTDVQTKAALTAGKPFVVFPANVEVEPINFDTLDTMHASLSIRCPESAIGNAGGPLFGMPCSFRDFERFVRGSEYHLANWREARPEKLIEGFNLGVTNFRGWALSEDTNQLRFRIAKYVASYDSSDYGDVGADLNGQAVFIAYYTPPRIASPTRTGQAGGTIPEDNPEFYLAEIAILPVHMKDVFTNQFESMAPSTLGSGTSFGPRPGLNGQWSWLNYPSDANPKGSTGRFVGEFRIHPKPEPSVVHAASFLYRRCTESIRARCPVDVTSVNPDLDDAQAIVSVSGLALAGATAAAKATAAEAANAAGFSTDVKVAGKLLGALPGAAVTVEIGARSLAGFVAKTAAAPTYTIMIPASSLAAPDLDTVGTGIGFIEDDDETDVGKLAYWVTTATEGSTPEYSTAYTVLAVTTGNELELA
jgi:hypothetical protein